MAVSYMVQNPNDMVYINSDSVFWARASGRVIKTRWNILPYFLDEF